MTTVQLRRHEVRPGEMENWVKWWVNNLVPAREHFGFKIHYAYVDGLTNQFIWAVSHDGDFDAVEKEYLTSPERDAAHVSQPKVIDKLHVSKVRVVYEG